MIKYICLFVVLISSLNVSSNENLLTIQQQLERLQREVSDLSQMVFSDEDKTITNSDNDLVKNLSAIDMRIYDIEKDVKYLTSNIEEIFFQIEDISQKINNFENIIVSLEESLLEIKNAPNTSSPKSINEGIDDENTLGSLKITTENTTVIDDETTVTDEEDVVDEENKKNETLTPEDQFQLAFDNIRDKKWKLAKESFEKFITNNPNNQLSGSAHYWLGELHILEKQYRDAALIFAEGYQKFPESIKAPDMLFKLSLSLYEVNKIDDACKTLRKFIIDYPKNKFVKNAKKQIQDYECLEISE